MDDRREILLHSRTSDISQRRIAAKERKLRVRREKAARVKKLESETTAYRVFNRSFPMLVPAIHTYSEEYIAEWGVRGDVIYGGDKDVQSTMSRDRSLILPVSDMVIVVVERGGYDSRFVRLSDAAKAYDIAVDHLEAFVKLINRPHMHLPYIPWEDLYNLDKLCAWLYPKAKNFFATEKIAHEGNDMHTVMSQYLVGHDERQWLDQSELSKGYIRGVADEHVPVMSEIHPDRIPEEMRVHAL